MVQGGFRVDWDATNHNLVTLQGDLYDGRIEELGPDDITVTGGNILGRWTHTFSEDSDFQFQVYYDRTRRRIPNLFGEDLDTYDLDWQHRFALGQRQVVIWGLGYRLNDDDVNNSPLLSFLPAQKTFQTYSAFVQDEIILIEDRLRLTLGSKFEHNDYTGFEVQPSGRLTWVPTERQTIWAAISRAVRTPSRIDRHFHFPSPPVPAGITNLAGGPDFDSETLIAYELGYRVQPYSPLSFSISTFYNDYDELRSLEPAGATSFVVENKLGGETYGVELSATYQVNEWWRVRGGYTFLEKHLSPKP